MIAIDLVKLSWRVYRLAGIGVLVKEVLRYLIFYGSPKKVALYWFCKLKGKSWKIRDVQGSKMWLNYQYGGIHADLIMNGVRELAATAYMQTILQPGWVVVDIGANIGYYALMEARICREVLAIEPEPSNYELLLSNIELNGYKNVATLLSAVGDRNGAVELALSEVANWHRVKTRGTKKDTITVPMVTMDAYLMGKRVDMVRMDVEGYEFHILKGMEQTIANNPGLTLFIELHGEYLKEYGTSAEEVLEFLSKHNFVVTNSTLVAIDKPIAPLDAKLIKKIAKGCIADHLFFRKAEGQVIC